MAVELSAAEVVHVARLARLELSAEESESVAGQLSTILDHVEAVRALDLEGVPATSHPLELVNVLRPDVERPCLDRADALGGAPAVEDGRFAVPRILSEAP